MAVITGTSGNDVLVGTDVADVINALAGDDEINATPGNDRIDGGDGFDLVDYSISGEGVTVDLSLTGPQNVVETFFETLISIPGAPARPLARRP